MKIIWHNQGSLNNGELSAKIKFEFDFRKHLNLFILKNESIESEVDLNSYVFDYFPEQNLIKLSSKTPEPDYSILNALWSDFINTVGPKLLND